MVAQSRTKKLIEQAILLSISAIKFDIESNADATDNATRAQAIKALAEAYDIVRRGKRGDC